jgi:hypothetical protein
METKVKRKTGPRPKYGVNMTRFHVWLPPSLRMEILRICVRRKIRASTYVREAIEAKLKADGSQIPKG